MWKSLAGRYYQFPSGHAVIGTYLHDKIKKDDTSECWWCDSGEVKVPVPSFHSMSNVVEGGLERVRLEAPPCPLGQAPMG